MTGRTARGIVSTIGLAKESSAHHQESKQAEQSLGVPSEGANRPPSPPPAADCEFDEEVWQLDDVEQAEERPPDPFTNVANEQQLVNIFETMHPPAYSEVKGRLPLPVCLPQRRPRHRTRGFI